MKVISSHELARKLLTLPNLPVTRGGVIAQNVQIRDGLQINTRDGGWIFYATDEVGGPEWLEQEMKREHEAIQVVDID